MPKKQRKQIEGSDDDEPQDIMAWGNKKENFYKEGED